MSKKQVRVWECKIVIEGDELPPGFDSPPRMAAENAIEAAGFKVLMNSSGWGGTLTKSEEDYLNKGHRSDVYYAGVMDTLEDVAH